MASLTKDQLGVLFDTLLGTCMSVETALEQQGLDGADYDQEAVEELLEADNLIRCEGCGYWCPLDEIAEDSDPPRCLDCGEP